MKIPLNPWLSRWGAFGSVINRKVYQQVNKEGVGMEASMAKDSMKMTDTATKATASTLKLDSQLSTNNGLQIETRSYNQEIRQNVREGHPRETCLGLGSR